jgi:hypothetical protein
MSGKTLRNPLSPVAEIIASLFKQFLHAVNAFVIVILIIIFSVAVDYDYDYD